MLGLISFIGLMLTWALKLLQIASKAAVFMIVKMGMWVAVLYVVGCCFVCSALGIPLGDPVAVKALWIGAVVSAAVGFVGTSILFEYQRRKKKFGTFAPEPFHFYGSHRQQQEKETPQDENPRSDAPALQSPVSDGTESEYGRGYRDAMREVQREREREFEREKWRSEEKARQQQRSSVSTEPLLREQQAYTKEQSAPPSESVGQGASRANGFEPVPDRFSESRQAPRRTVHKPYADIDIYPLVFITRKDPNILVVEYSDRLVYFRRDPRGGQPIFVASEFKNGY